MVPPSFHGATVMSRRRLLSFVAHGEDVAGVGEELGFGAEGDGVARVDAVELDRSTGIEPGAE